MDRLTRRFRVARKALKTLQNILQERSSDVVRDAAIQRFEYSFETVWKAAQLHLRQKEGLELASPKSVIRSAGHVALLDADQVQRALRMADDRNLTVHTYNESVAKKLYARLPGYAGLMLAWLNAMNPPRRKNAGRRQE